MPTDLLQPVSLTQGLMLGLDTTAPGMTGEWFTMNAVLHLSGPVDPGVLTAAANELVARHDILRTRIPPGSDPVQVVAARATPAVEVLDGGDEPETAWIHAPVPRDLPCPLVLRLVRRGRGDHVLAVHLHHLVSDPTTVWTVLTELAALYTAIAAGAPLPPGPVAQFGEYVACEARQAELGADAAHAWWSAAMDRPFAAVRDFGTSAPYAFRTEVLPAGDLAAAQRLAKSHRATILTTLFAALACAMRSHVTGDALLFSTVFGKRDRPEWRRVLGPCILVAHVPLPPPPAHLTPGYTQAVRDILVNAHRHARIDPALVRAMNPCFEDPDTVVPFFEYVPDDWVPTFAFGAATAHLRLAAGPKDVGLARNLAIRSRQTADGALTAHVGGNGRGWAEPHVRGLWPEMSARILAAS
jgi:condensation domain-containing protein